MNMLDRDRLMKLMDCSGSIALTKAEHQNVFITSARDAKLMDQLKKEPIFRNPVSRSAFGTSWKSPVGDCDGDMDPYMMHLQYDAQSLYTNAVEAMKKYAEKLRKENEEVSGKSIFDPERVVKCGYNPLVMEDRIDKFLKKAFGVKDIIFSPPATIVFWMDGEKTVVKCSKGAEFNPYYGFCAAVCKKLYPSNSQLNKVINDCWEKSKKSMSKKVLSDIQKAGKKVKNQKPDISYETMEEEKRRNF